MGKNKPNKRPLDDSDLRNIPGHYYDEKKKKLFKLAGNEFSKIPGVLTKEKLKAEENENKRLKDLKRFSKFNGTKNLTHLLYLQQVEPKRSHHFSHEITSSIFSSMKCRGRLDAVTLTRATDNAYIKKIVLGPSNNSVAVLAEGSVFRTINQVNFKYTRNGLALEKISSEPDNFLPKNFHFTTSVKSSVFLYDNVVDVCWCGGEKSVIFANATGPKEPSHLFMYGDPGFEMLTLENYIFSSAHSKEHMAAVGQEFGIDLYNLPGTLDANGFLKPLKTLSSNRCQVHSASFSKDGKLLYYGDLKGHIRLYDLREKSIQSLIVLDQPARVDSLYVCADWNYLLSSYNDGRILMADLRMKKFVLKYDEHMNDYMKLPIHVNPTEEYMASVGSDCYTRLWDLKTSKLLRTIPSQAPATRARMPAVFFVPTMSHAFTGSVPGLFVAIEKDIFVYF